MLVPGDDLAKPDEETLAGGLIPRCMLQLHAMPSLEAPESLRQQMLHPLAGL